MSFPGNITDWQYPTAEIRDHIAAKMASAWSLSKGNVIVPRTKYPSGDWLQAQLEAKEKGTGLPDGTAVEQYFVVTPGFDGTAGNEGMSGQQGQTYLSTVKIFVCRKVGDTPHDDAATMLARAGQLINALLPTQTSVAAGTGRWPVHGYRMANVERCTCEFEGSEEIFSNKWTAVLIQLTLHLDVAGL